jgi:hypothetical protein
MERPGDRRRFCYYAKSRNIKFELADPSETYDLVVVSAAADISLWSRYKCSTTKIVYDLTDSYLAIAKLNPKGLLRGLAKYATRQNRYLLWSYTGGVREMCTRADAVVCTTAEQRQDILPHCKNVHIILDFHGSVVRSTKTNYSSGEVFNVVWEGLAGNLSTLQQLIPALCEMQKGRPVAIHVVTQLSYGQYLNGRFIKRRTEDLLGKIPIPHYLYAWSEQTCSNIICACDLAIIPIPMQDSLYAGKPENKLHLFWRMAMPTLASSTLAHTRAMQDAGIPMACKTPQDWRDALAKYSDSEELRMEAGQRGKEFVAKYHSEEILLARWDEVFSSIVENSDRVVEADAAPKTDIRNFAHNATF